ncbi:MAG: glycosyltransferase [Prolixibacteraceae bacterium]
MNILLITQLFPYDSEARYTSGALREFAVAWSNAGHRVKVVRPHYAYEREPFPANPEFRIGDQIEVEFIKPLRIPLLKMSWYSRRKLIKSLPMKPDVLICHLYNAYFPFYSLAKKLDVPLIIGIHMSDVRLAENSFHRWLQKRVFRHASGFACRSHAYLKLFTDRFPECSDRTFLALSGIPGEYLANNRQTVSRSANRIISVCRLIKRKQIDKVLQVLAKMNSGSGWEYVVVGNGDEEQRLKGMSHDLGIAGKVRFTGELSRDEVIRELRESDLFILPSYDETLGLVYLEAMACGCITIGARNEGIDGIIRDGENGFLCDAASEASIGQKLVQAMQLSEVERKKMRDKTLQSVEGFSIAQKAEAYLEHIKKYLPAENFF